MTQKSVNGGYWQPPPLERHQIVLFETCLEDRIPEDHPVRLLGEILEGLDWTAWENTYNRRLGQPPIHPRILCSVLLFAMIRRIRSSRNIEYNIKHSIDFMWLVSGRTIDHTTISEFRRKHKVQIKDIHKQMIRVAVDMGAAQLSELCIDGSRVLANASRSKTWTADRVEKLLKELDGQIEDAMAEMETNDSVNDLFDDGTTADHLPPELAARVVRRDQMKDVLEQLKRMDAARQAKGRDPQKNPAQLPKTDLDARILPNKEGGYAPNYTPMVVNEMINGFIVDADVLIGNVEHLTLLTTIDTLEAEFGIHVDTVMADSAYPTGENISGMEARNTEFLSPLPTETWDDNPAVRDNPAVPVADENVARLPVNPQTKRFDKSAFVYDEDADCYHCPVGKTLSRKGEETRSRAGGPVLQIIYVCDDCEGCPLVAQCRVNPASPRGRKVSHDEHHVIRECHRDHMSTAQSQESYKRRMHFGETPFAVMKACFDMRRFLLRGLERVQTEWQWCCTAFNLKKLIRLVAAMRAEQSENSEMAVRCGI